MKLYISFHSYGQFILTPFGHTSITPPNHYEIMMIGLKGKEAISERAGRDYIVGPIAEVMCK